MLYSHENSRHFPSSSDYRDTMARATRRKRYRSLSFWKWNLAHTWHELTTRTPRALSERVRGWVKKFSTASHNQTDVKIEREESKHTLDNFVWAKLRRNTSYVTLNITQVKRRSFVTVVVIVSHFKPTFRKFLNM